MSNSQNIPHGPVFSKAQELSCQAALQVAEEEEAQEAKRLYKVLLKSACGTTHRLQQGTLRFQKQWRDEVAEVLSVPETVRCGRCKKDVPFLEAFAMTAWQHAFVDDLLEKHALHSDCAAAQIVDGVLERGLRSLPEEDWASSLLRMLFQRLELSRSPVRGTPPSSFEVNVRQQVLRLNRGALRVEGRIVKGFDIRNHPRNPGAFSAPQLLALATTKFPSGEPRYLSGTLRTWAYQKFAHGVDSATIIADLTTALDAVLVVPGAPTVTAVLPSAQAPVRPSSALPRAASVPPQSSQRIMAGADESGLAQVAIGGSAYFICKGKECLTPDQATELGLTDELINNRSWCKDNDIGFKLVPVVRLSARTEEKPSTAPKSENKKADKGKKGGGDQKQRQGKKGK